MNVIVEPFLHHGSEVLGIVFTYDAALNLAVRKIKGIKWSWSRSCWYLPLTRENYELVQTALPRMATIDIGLLKAYLQKRTAVKAATPAPVTKQKRSVQPSPVWHIAPVNREALRRFVEQLKLKAYSASTIRTYHNEFLQLLKTLKGKPVLIINWVFFLI